MLNGATPTLQIDTTNLAQIQQTLPFRPSCSSMTKTGEQNFFMLHYDCLPAFELPTYSTQEHHIFSFWGIQSQAHRIARIDNVLMQGQYGCGQNSIVPVGTSHYVIWDRPIEASVIFLNPQFIRCVAQDLPYSDRIELIPTHDSQNMTLHHLGMAFKTEMQRSHGLAKNTIYQESIMTAFVMQLLQYHAVKPAKPKIYEKGLSQAALRQIMGYIEAHLTQDLKLTELANLVHFSPYYLCRLFKQSTGQTLHQYILEKRLERAHTLLRQSNLSVVEISSRCGFSNHSHLNRHFKNKYGIPPSHLRQA